MAQYEVPQFIEREARILGPLTMRQFLYLTGVGAGLIILYTQLPFNFFLVVTALVVSVALPLIFIQFNGRPLISVVGAMAGFFLVPQTFVWQRRVTRADGKKLIAVQKPAIKLNREKLDKLADILNTHDL